jgi:hypothetical protein
LIIVLDSGSDELGDEASLMGVASVRIKDLDASLFEKANRLRV